MSSERPSNKATEPKPQTPNTDVMQAELQALADQFLDPSQEKDGLVESYYSNRDGGKVDLERYASTDGIILSARILDVDMKFVASVDVPLTGKRKAEYRLNPPVDEHGDPDAEGIDLEKASDPELSKIAALLQPAKNQSEE